jgi:hypothetical protein
VAEKGVHPIGFCRMERREMLYFGFLCVDKSVRA